MTYTKYSGVDASSSFFKVNVLETGIFMTSSPEWGVSGLMAFRIYSGWV